jgi:AraC-like DNA-binding protein
VRDAAQLTNGTLSLHELLPRSMSRIRQLARVVDGTGIADELCAHLLAMRRQPVDRRAELLFRATHEAASTAQRLDRALGLGERATRGWARRTLGMSVRRFRSIRRLHGALLRRVASPALTWSQIAAFAGYADQSHLIRDCRAFPGETPARFAARAGSYKTTESSDS